MRPDSEMLTEAFKMLVKVQDANARMLGGGGNRQVGEGKAMGTVRAVGRELAHRRQDRALDAAIHWNLAQAIQGALDSGDPV